MAAPAARAVTKQLLRLNSRGILRCRHSYGLQELGLLGQNGVSWSPSSHSRGISQFPRSQSSRPRGRFQPDEEEEDEYEVQDDDLETLRKTHRAEAKSAHSSQEGKHFKDFPLNEKLCNRLEELGYSEPFEIQAATLEHTLAGRDVVAKALTGSGKTLAFSVPIVHTLLERGQTRSNKSPKAIVISPTRELCMQIHRSIQELDPRVRCVAVYGGDSMTRQERELRRGVDVVCATPGRLNDHLERGTFNLQELAFLCLDEADELLTPGFMEQIQNVLETSPKDKQVMMFSATMPGHIRGIARRHLNDPVQVDITANQHYKAPESVRHLCMQAPRSQHIYLVKSLIEEHKPERCIVFMETKHKTREAALTLRKRMGLKADGISSDLSQSRRENIMAAFRAGIVKILVATDVAARGLDIPEVDLVIQVSPPRNGTEYYIHRSGRTGRGGREGLAVLIHEGNTVDKQAIREIGKLAKMEFVSPPDHETVMADTAKETLARLQRKSSARGTESLLPMIEELGLTADGANRLVAAALSTMVTGSDETREARPSYQRNQNNRQGGGRQNYGRGQSHGRGLRGWDEEEGPRGRQNYQGGRSKSNRGAGSDDWKDFY